jgi:hypothetical protein
VPVYFQIDFFGNYAGDFIGCFYLDVFSQGHPFLSEIQLITSPAFIIQLIEL